MQRLSRLFIFAVLFAALTTHALTDRELQWLGFPGKRFEVLGLPWFKENSPELWRLPKSMRDKVPPAVWARAVFPDGGRISFTSDTGDLMLRVELDTKGVGFFDVFVDDNQVGSARPDGDGSVVLFKNLNRNRKDITIYMPHKTQVRVVAVGIDPGSSMTAANFTRGLPIVCYGSSVLQGSGAMHPSETYPAVVARSLNMDFVNLGFGGAGRAEPLVVSLVNKLEASCYLFDLGKSYGNQSADAFAKMLRTIRDSHPDTPIIVVTPIYSTKELDDPAFQKRSETLRAQMRSAATEMRDAGDKNIYIIEGPTLFGEPDKDLLHDPLHPNDQGCELMAERLLPTLKRAIH